jgi:urea carboxylase
MSTIDEPDLGTARYSHAGDEFVFVELSEELSFRSNFKARAILRELEERRLPGIVDLCPNSASYLVRFDPDTIAPADVIDELKAIDAGLGDPADFHFRARLVEVPIFYDDPWTTELVARYGDRRQAPELTDLEYMARANGFRSVPDLVDAHSGSPWLVMGVGFTPGCYWSAQMVPRERVIVAPTYIRPRTETPERAFSQGGAFAAIYPSPGPGGYQLIGMAPAPIFEPQRRHMDFGSTGVFTRTGDVFHHRPLDREEHDRLRARVEAGTFEYRVREVDFEPARLFEDPDRYNAELLDVLYA